MTPLSVFQRLLNVGYEQIEENTASFFAKKSGDTLELLFEGSNGKTDWKNNFDFPARPYHEMKDRWFVHRGFCRVWKTIKPRIEFMVKDRSVKKIIVAGYSHGAAIAVLCFEYCVFNRPDIARDIYGMGFGCPRVIWGHLNERVKARYKNFTVFRNGKDIVTHLPPVLFGFHHVGTVARIGYEIKQGPFRSHYPENYIKALENLSRRCEE